MLSSPGKQGPCLFFKTLGRILDPLSTWGSPAAPIVVAQAHPHAGREMAGHGRLARADAPESWPHSHTPAGYGAVVSLCSWLGEKTGS